MVDFWPVLFDVGTLLGVAFVLGSLCERFRQSALLGYLLAGMLLGPNALNVVSTSTEVEGLAEVGVCLLLFSLGLEFSLRRLRALGWTALGGGVLQVTLTLAAVALIGGWAGLSAPTAVVVGAAFALSSTAGVLRVLMVRSEIDSVHGRHALGVLLFQDLAVIPLVVVTAFLGAPTSESSASLWILGRTVLMLALMVAGFYVVFNHVVPRVFLATFSLRNRELPVLLAVAGALGAIYVAHDLGLSPAVGAFIAGILLGESPFATQVRSDLSVLRTLLVTVFFSSIGMLADPVWIVENVGLTFAVATGVLVLKALLCAAALRLMRQTVQSSIAAGLCLSQVGEFAFVIAETSRGTLIDDGLFMVIVSTMMVTLCVTPYLIAWAPRGASAIAGSLNKLGLLKEELPDTGGERERLAGHVIVVGYGPAGQRSAEVLRSASLPISILDLNPGLASRARNDGFEAYVGDGTHPEVLEHVRVASAAVVVVTLPDPSAAEETVRAISCQAMGVPVVVRSRYHRHADALESAGASAVVDEEQEVGNLLGQRAEILVSRASEVSAS